MKRNTFFILGLIAVLFLISPLYSLQKNYNQNGVEVTVEKVEDTLKGFKAFKVSARNTTSADRSLNAKIFLQNVNAKMAKGGSGSCTIFMGLPAGASKSEVKQCKETSPSNEWTFEIVKVYNFLLK